MKTCLKKSTARRALAFFAAFIMAFTSLPLAALATDESGARPEDGINYGSPFISGSPSQNYRIPNLVTMNDGTLVAQADARWDAYADGGGNDSIVAYSEDNGESWHYSMLTYYPDNGNFHNTSSTSVCDSSLATNGDMLYTLTTFFPAGYALNTTSADHTLTALSGSAFNDDGTLKLSRNGSSSYDYYLGDFSADGEYGRAPIYSTGGSQVTGWDVDHDFYVYYNGVKQGNLFYDDCEFQTVKTNFLLFRSSSDGGRTWSDFELVNVKSTSEAFYGVGPGRGVVTEDGTIVFGCYSWTNLPSTQRSSFIYSKDGGDTWTRMDNIPGSGMTSWTSECQVVALEDGTIRLFCRNNSNQMLYADAVPDENGNYSWANSITYIDSTINGQNLNITQNNQYSVIRYSKKVLWNGDYYSLLISSHASGSGSSRTNGALTFLLLDDNNEVVNASRYPFMTGSYEYSCLTELNDGRIGLLYEYASDGSSLEFTTFNVEDASGFYIPDAPKNYDISLVAGDSQNYYVSDKAAADSYDTSIINAEFEPNYTSTANIGSDSTLTGAQVMLTDALYTFNQSSNGEWYAGNSDIYLNIGDTPASAVRNSVSVNYIDGGYFQFISENNEALYFNISGDNAYQFTSTNAYDESNKDYEQTLFELYTPVNTAGESSENEDVPGYVRINDLSELQDGKKYLIGCRVNGDFYFLYPSRDAENIYTFTAKANKDYVENGYSMMITALGAGNTTIVCGSDTYNVEVTDYSREITGVVDYDPVIYTHGSDDDITTFGSAISDGSVEGEKVTEYRLNDETYEILSITAMEDLDKDSALPNSFITADNGRLTGTLDLASSSEYNSYESGTYVTLKTNLRDSTGLVWTQIDRLYVASNPVPGHVIVGNFNRQGTSVIGWGVNLSTYVMAMDSYGNTTMTAAQLGSDYVGNAPILFPTSSNYFTYNNAIGELAVLSDGTSDKKYTGAPENSANTNTWGSQSYTLNFLDNVSADTVNVAYYYYDKSSDKNEGITADTSAPDSFSINMGRMPVNSQYSADSGWSKNVTINNSSVTKLSGLGTIENNTALFGTGEYTILDNNHRKTGSVQLSTLDDGGIDTVEPNTTANLKGVVQYQETAARTDGRATSVNNVRLTFEVKMCDKSNERTVYDKAVSSIMKSTWYTQNSWDNYIDSLLVYQEYLNNYTLLTTDAVKTSEGESYYDYLYDEEGNSVLDSSYSQLERVADFTEYDAAKAELFATLADEKYSVADLQAIDQAIKDLTYYDLTDEDRDRIYDSEQPSIDAETEKLNALTESLVPVAYDDLSAAEAAAEMAKSSRDPDVYDLSTLEFSYTAEVSVGGVTVVGFIYPSQTRLDEAVADFLNNIKKQIYSVYLNGRALGTAEYGTAVIASSDSYMVSDVDDVDSPAYDGEKSVAWSYSYAAPSRDYAQTTPKYMITAKSVGFIVKGDTYLTSENAVSDEDGYVVKFVTNGGKIFDVQYTTDSTVTVPQAPNYAFYRFTGYEGGYTAGEEITVTGDTTIVANYTANTSNSYSILVYDGLEAWEEKAPSSDEVYKYNELVDLSSDDAYCWVSAIYNEEERSTDLTLLAYGTSYSFYACRSYDNGALEGIISLTEAEYQRILIATEGLEYYLYDGAGNLIEATYDEYDNPVYPAPVATVSVLENVVPVYDENGNLSKFSMIGTFTLPEDYTIVEYGILFSSDQSADLTVENAGKDGIARMKSSSCTCGNQFVINVKTPSDGSPVTFKYCGYAIVQDADGNLKTLYSKSVLGTTEGL